MSKQIMRQIINEAIKKEFEEEVTKFRILHIYLTNINSQVDLCKVILFHGQRTLDTISIEYIT